MSRTTTLAVAWMLFLAGAPRAVPAQSLSGLPLHEVASARPGGDRLALLLTGDGGWAGIDKDIARTLSDSGIAVVGFDLATYLRTRRTPAEVARDADRILTHYLAAWERSRIVVVGYSRGAQVAPFLVHRLPDSTQARIDLVAMLGLATRAGFHVTMLDLLKTTSNPKDPPVEPEVQALAAARIPMLCVYGMDEEESYCRDAPEGLMTRIGKSGGHHFDGDHPGLARDILSALPRP